MRIAITADLHWGIRAEGDAATRQLVAELAANPVDLIVLAGDVGAGDDFERCLELFAPLPGRKALIPGNHDVWVNANDARGDSWQVYSQHLPDLCRQFGFHYLDHAPLIFPEADLAIVGSINWYDYSWADDPEFAKPDDWDDRIRDMRFSRGRHNDRRFVRWHHTDVSFTAHCVATLERHLAEARQKASKVIVVTHHPAFSGLNFPGEGPMTLDRLLWHAFSGNRSLEQVLERNADRIAWIFSGHTHRVRENQLGTIRGHNIGGDYDWKRLLLLDWPGDGIEAREFP